MFNSISGTITGKFPRQIFIESHGIEWDIFVPDICLEEFGTVGSTAKVYTWLNHYENGMDLYGFFSAEERSLFFDLLKVEGIGPKAAVRIMSSISVKELVAVLDSGEVGALERLPGVGKKTAAKMMLTLKGKLTIPDESPRAAPKQQEYAVVIQSLVDMGYEKSECERCVSEVAERLSNDATFTQKSQQKKEDTLFTEALRELAR